MINDPRSKKVAFVAHCLLNHNARVNGLAKVPAGYLKLVELLFERGYGIAQLPCPETAFLGLRRWWHVKEQYESMGYREFCRKILQPTILMMKEFYREGYDIIVIGVDGSPSCGVEITGSSDEWGGEPSLEKDLQYPLKKGTGAFIEVLKEELIKAGIDGVRIIGLKTELPGYNLDASLDMLERIIEKD